MKLPKRTLLLVLTLLIIVCLLLSVLFFWLVPMMQAPNQGDPSDSSSTTTTTKPVTDNQADYEYFKDPNFSRGIDMGCASYQVEKFYRGNIYFNGNIGATPWWTGAQNFSRFEIIGTQPSDLGDGLFGFKNEGKLLATYRDEDGSTALRMEVYGDAEFVEGEERGNWPHLLIGADSLATNPRCIANFSELTYSMDVKINYCENTMTEEEYDPSRHCAQTTAYFIIQNLERGSKGYGEFIWFGIPIYDNRSDFPGSMLIIDGDPSEDSDRGATGAVIYVIGGDDMLEEIYDGVNPKDGEWAHAEVNILPYIKAALMLAQNKGLMTNTTFEQLSVGGFNLGWEVTGEFRASMDVKNISLYGKAGE